MNTTQQRHPSLLLLGLGLLLLVLWSCESKMDVEPLFVGKKKINCGFHHMEVKDSILPSTDPLSVKITRTFTFYDTCHEVICVDGVCDTILTEPFIKTTKDTTILVNTPVTRLIGRHSLCMIEDKGSAILLGDGVFSTRDTYSIGANLFSLNLAANEWLLNSDFFANQSSFYDNNIQYLVQESVYSNYDQSVYYVAENHIIKYEMPTNSIDKELSFDASKKIYSNVVYSDSSPQLYFFTEQDTGSGFSYELLTYDIASQQLSYVEIDTDFALLSRPAIAWYPPNSSLLVFAEFKDIADTTFYRHTLIELNLAEKKYQVRSFFNPRFYYTNDQVILYNSERNSVFAIGYESIDVLDDLGSKGTLTIWEFDLANNQWRQHSSTPELSITLEKFFDFYRQPAFRVVQDVFSKTLLFSFIDNQCYKYDYEREVVDSISAIPVN